MALAIGTRVIEKICFTHGLQYGNVKEPEEAVFEAGFCDVCEALGPGNVPQSVTSIDTYGGVKGDIFHTIKTPNP